MFADAIETVSRYTRPVKFISRNYGSEEIIRGTATLFFVNEKGDAVTCKHVTDEIQACAEINAQYEQYKAEIAILPTKEVALVKSIAERFGFQNGSTVQYHCMLFDCVEAIDNAVNMSIIPHPKYDLSVIRIENPKAILYSGYAVFAKDSSVLRSGDFLCRYGYPFSEFSDYKYDSDKDELNWISRGRIDTPSFPIEGMYTRDIVDENNDIYGYELSTPGLRGQSGGPLFNSKGIVFGMQSQTAHLHLGFDQSNAKVRIDGQMKEVEDHPFFHVGRCITVDVIKQFLNDNKIKYYVGDSEGHIEAVNGDEDV